MILGIDLGTTNSLGCIWKDGKPTLIPNCFGEYLTPSVVGVDDNNQIIVGKVAKERLITAPDKTIAHFKRYMGSDKKLKIGNQRYTAEELSSFVLKKIIEDTEIYTKEKVDEIIVSVPAYFNDDQRWATKAAGHLAGVHIERIINEPSAAALAFHQSRNEDSVYMVVDFGGGTLDISIVDSFDNIIEIISVAGDNRLGGDDFNALIVEEFLNKNHLLEKNISDSDKEFLYREAERCKRAFDNLDEFEMKVNINNHEFNYIMTYDHFFELSKFMLLRIATPIEKALNDSRNKIDDIDQVILVGGSCKMRIVHNYISHMIKKKIDVDVNPDTTIALGCGIVAGIKERKEDIKDVLLTDICPFTLGIGMIRDMFSPIIERNSILPSSREEYYCTTELGQEYVCIPVYQGESMKASDNIKLATFNIDVPVNYTQNEKFTVRFTYDINGILEVDVHITSTGEKYHEVIVNESNRMTPEQIQERLQELQKLKMHPRDKDKYRYILERANRIYMSSLGLKRTIIGQWASNFEEALLSQEIRVIERAYSNFEKNLNSIETNKDEELLS